MPATYKDMHPTTTWIEDVAGILNSSSRDFKTKRSETTNTRCEFLIAVLLFNFPSVGGCKQKIRQLQQQIFQKPPNWFLVLLSPSPDCTQTSQLLVLYGLSCILLNHPNIFQRLYAACLWEVLIGSEHRIADCSNSDHFWIPSHVKVKGTLTLNA